MHFFVGLGALYGGGAAVLNPVSPLGFPIEMLSGTPFKSFLVPGLIRLIVIGIGSMVSGFTAFYKSGYQGYFSSFSSWALMILLEVLL